MSRRCVAARAALLWASLLFPGPLQAAPHILGFNLPTWWNDGYSTPGAGRSLENLAATGASWVALVPTWYVAGAESSEVRPTDATASDDSLRAYARAAKRLGLRVALKPHVDCQDGSPRALLRPKDRAAWFASYRKMLRHYAGIAAEEKLDLLVVGTELGSMSTPADKVAWVGLIADARGLYPGPLTYAANFYDFEVVPFWSSVDFVGIDGYFPLAGGANKELLKLSWQPYLSLIRGVSAAVGKPVLFTEIGVASQKGATARPWEWRDKGPLDLETQKAYFEAFLEVFDRENFFAGFFQWAWTTDPAAGGPQDKSMTVQGKPALAVLKAYFGRRRPSLIGRVHDLAEALRRAVGPLEKALRLGPGGRLWD